MGYNSISQTVTNKNTPPVQDSLICIHKSVAIKIIEDLEKGDRDSASLVIANQNNLLKDNTIRLQKTTISKLEDSERSLKNSLLYYKDVDSLNQETIKNWDTKYQALNRKKKGWTIATIFMTLLLIIK